VFNHAPYSLRGEAPARPASAPLKRLVTRPEVAEMMALICASPAMQTVTGHTFVMDGGWRLTA